MTAGQEYEESRWRIGAWALKPAAGCWLPVVCHLVLIIIVSRHAATAAAAAPTALLMLLAGTPQCSQHLLGWLHHGIAVHLQGTSMMPSAACSTS